MTDLTIVPDRNCGTCTACCYALAFDAEGITKKAGPLCVHHTGSGCRIYETRFNFCRAFLCGWRRVAELPDEWRPDRSGVMLIVMPQSDVPDAYRAAGDGVVFKFIEMGEAAVTRPGLA